MLSDSLIIGLVILLLCGAVSFYLYARLMYTEKKLTVMESILVDMRVALDSIMSERGTPASIPIAHTPNGEVPGPPKAEEAAPVEDMTDVSGEVAPVAEDDKFYGAVLDQVHDTVVESEVVEVAAVATVSYEKMSRAELAAHAEKNGFRVKKSMSRGEIESMLRRSAAAQNATPTTGTGNVSGSMEGPSENGALLSGDGSLDSGANGALLESTI